MSVEIHNLQRMAVYAEPAGSFAVDNSATPANFQDVPFIEGTAQLTLNRTQLEPATAEQFIDGYPDTVSGTKPASLTFQMVLAPTGVAAGGGTLTIDDSDGATGSAQIRILTAIMGGLVPDNPGLDGSLVVTGTSETQFDVTAGEAASNFVSGGACGVPTGASNAIEAREIEDAATDTITLKHELTTAPTATDDVYNASTLYLTENPATSLQFIVEGRENTDRWLVQGAQGGFTLEMPIGELPKITFTLEAATWTQLSGASITAATYRNFSPTAFVPGEFLAQVTGTATRSIVQVSSIAYNPNITYVPVPSPSGTETILRWRRARSVPVCEVQFTTLYDDPVTGPVTNTANVDWHTERDDKDDYHLAMQIGQTAGSIVLVVCPRAQITDVQRVDDNGLASVQVTARAKHDTDFSDTANELLRSPLRIHLM